MLDVIPFGRFAELGWMKWMALLLDEDNQLPISVAENHKMLHLVEHLWWMCNRIRLGEQAPDWTIFAGTLVKQSNAYVVISI